MPKLICTLNSTLVNLVRHRIYDISISENIINKNIYNIQKRLYSDSWEVTDEKRPRVSELDIHKRVLSGSDRSKLKRDDFHQFMKGKRPLFSNQFKINLQGVLILSWCGFAGYMTWKIMAPEDYSWIESERQRIKDARDKLDKIIKLERT